MQNKRDHVLYSIIAKA
jgi:hypothetical protein